MKGRMTPSTLKFLTALLNAVSSDAVSALWGVIEEVLPLRARQGLYEVLEYDAHLELLDPQARRAAFHRRQKVRFLQDNVIAYQDQVWGEGDIFASYRCAPGVPVDRYQDGNSYRVLISLRGTRNRGDLEELHIWREIRDGFPHQVENFQNKVNHFIHRFRISLIFPAQRHPRRVVLIQENAARTLPLAAEHVLTLPDGRQQVSWETRRPKLHEMYTFRWEW